MSTSNKYKFIPHFTNTIYNTRQTTNKIHIFYQICVFSIKQQHLVRVIFFDNNYIIKRMQYKYIAAHMFKEWLRNLPQHLYKLYPDVDLHTISLPDSAILATAASVNLI
jgi:hypothetical protein